jgi:hypothetical protein
MISIADILNRPKIVLFPDNREDSFYKNCKAREEGIKETHRICLKSFNTHLFTFKEKENQLSKWEKEKIKSCSGNLGDYLKYLTGELDKSKIEDYCSLADKLSDRFIPFLPDWVLLMVNSYQGAIETDLHWVSDLAIGDLFDISLGDFDFNKLERYLQNRFKEIEALCEKLSSLAYVSARTDSICEVISSYRNNHIKASNLLMITTIEGLVRSLGIFLVEKQSLENIDPLNKRKYASLDSFLQKIPWKSDIKLNSIKYGLITGNYSLNTTGDTSFVMSNLTDRLGFLSRRFKEHRNVILHGENVEYANSLNTFLNSSALQEVLTTIEEYQILYN